MFEIKASKFVLSGSYKTALLFSYHFIAECSPDLEAGVVDLHILRGPRAGVAEDGAVHIIIIIIIIIISIITSLPVDRHGAGLPAATPETSKQ